MNANTKTIDFEAHYYSPAAFFERFPKRTEYPIFYPEKRQLWLAEDFYISREYHIAHLASSAEERLAEMDKYGVDMQILSHSPGLELMSTEDAVREARDANDYAYGLTQEYPKRFKAFAALPVQDIDIALKEFERCMNDLNFVGWLTFSNYGHTHLDDDEYLPLLAKAEELGAIVYLHPTNPITGRCTGLGPLLSGASFGFTEDISTTLIRMIYKGVFDRFPDLKVMIGHLGEVFPFILKRMDERAKPYFGLAENTSKNKNLPGYYFTKNIWVTTSGQYSHESFRCCKDVLGIERILFGSDYPYEGPDEVDDFLRNLCVSQVDMEKVLSGNAEACFGIEI